MQVAIGDEPDPKEPAADLGSLDLVSQLLAIVLCEVLQVAAVYQHHNGNRDAVELEQPEVAHDGSPVALEVEFQSPLPPPAEGLLGVLLTAGAGRLSKVRLPRHRTFLVVEREVEVGRIQIRLICKRPVENSRVHCRFIYQPAAIP